MLRVTFLADDSLGRILMTSHIYLCELAFELAIPLFFYSVLGVRNVVRQ